MHLCTFVWVVTLTQVHSHWEPCKIQCENNYRRNDLVQASLMNVCQRGCDLFTIALISTSQQTHPSTPLPIHPPKALPSQDVNSKTDTNGETKSLNVQNYILNALNKELKALPARDSNIKTIKSEEPTKLVHHVTLVRDIRQRNPSFERLTKTQAPTAGTGNSKTTVEPTSQPVQDHPAEASKETTTTKVPKKGTMKRRLDQAKHSCRHACVVAYGGAVEQEACVVGCHLQATTASLNPEEMNKNEDPKSPFGMIQRVVFNLASHVGRLVRVNWSWAAHRYEAPEQKLQEYGSESLTRQAQVPLFVRLRQSFKIDDSPKRNEILNAERNQEINIANDGFFHLPRPINHHESMNHHQEMPRIIAIIKEETKNSFYREGTNSFHKEPPKKLQEKDEQVVVFKEDGSSGGGLKVSSEMIDQEEDQHQLDLLDCISRKSGLPRWFIAIAIFASALVVLWLCFSLTAPPDDIKIVKTKPPESDCLPGDDDDDFEDDILSCSEKKKLLSRNDDVIKIRIENV